MNTNWLIVYLSSQSISSIEMICVRCQRIYLNRWPSNLLDIIAILHFTLSVISLRSLRIVVLINKFRVQLNILMSFRCFCCIFFSPLSIYFMLIMHWAQNMPKNWAIWDLTGRRRWQFPHRHSLQLASFNQLTVEPDLRTNEIAHWAMGMSFSSLIWEFSVVACRWQRIFLYYYWLKVFCAVFDLAYMRFCS